MDQPFSKVRLAQGERGTYFYVQLMDVSLLIMTLSH
jgi:hypothetical protein